MITLTDGAATLELDPEVGGRVSQLVVYGLDVLGTPEPSRPDGAAFVMAPWAGRIRRGRFEFDGTTYQLPTDRNPPHATALCSTDRGQSSTRHRRSPCSSAR
ncbi:MAG TPA: hypothetical protein VFI46_16790 [Jiangellaceae bacterium]|nr:hypothetical protein [Jiangellaceae bacterium]